MRLLVIGSGAREHAIAWKLLQSPQVSAMYVAPGNAGTATMATNLPIEATDISGLVETAQQNRVDMTFVGPEGPLAQGIVDQFTRENLAIFGPTKAAAQIEASKAFAKEFMQRRGIPCAQSATFDSFEEAKKFLARRSMPVVIKADGLAAGKGVIIAKTRAEAVAALETCMVERAFGDAGCKVVIEEFLEGQEVSVFAFTDSVDISPLVAACDYKRASDGDKGPNTGGMGSYSPPEFWTASLASEAEEKIFRPTVAGLADESIPYRGVLYGGLMLTRQGLKALEFNARLGDPETQVIMPLLQTDLIEIAQAVMTGNIAKTRIRWSSEACVGVVMASAGYPGPLITGLPISGLDTLGPEAMVFHGGTKMVDSEAVTSGGRVLTVVGKAPTMAQARDKAYATLESLHFEGAYYRRDIALRPIAAGAGRV